MAAQLSTGVRWSEIGNLHRKLSLVAQAGPLPLSLLRIGAKVPPQTSKLSE